jgi:phosphoserine phosphatase
MKGLTAVLSEKKITDLKKRRLAKKEIDCIEITLSAKTALPRHRFIKSLAAYNSLPGVDLTLQSQKSYAVPKRLVVMDVDSTLIQAEVIDELAKEAGVGEKIARITHRAMNGEIPFTEALKERVGLLKGLSDRTLYRVYKRIQFTPGAEPFLLALKKRGYKIALLTGGFDYFVSRFQKKFGLDYAFANGLEIKKNQLTGRVLGEIVDGQKKRFFMEKIARMEGFRLNQVIAIGDGANDLFMIKRAGLGIAFNAKPSVRAKAPHALTQKSMTSILHLLGIPEKAI